MSETEKKAKELIIQFMPHCSEYEFGKYVGDEKLFKNARDCTKKCVIEIIKADPTMPRTIPDNDDDLHEDVKKDKYFQIAQSKDYWNDVLKAIDFVRL